MAANTINIISVASDIGSVYAGKSRAPHAFKEAKLQAKLRTAGFHVTESPALSTGVGNWVASTREPHGARNEDPTINACTQVHQAVATALSSADGNQAALPFQLILSGECLYCPAIMSAYWNRLADTNQKVGILYVDADCDLATPQEVPGTGNIAGMTLTHLTLRDGALASMKRFSRPDGHGVVDSNNIVLFGLNIDSPANQRPHLGYLFDHGFRVVTSAAVQKAPRDEAQSAVQWLEERVDRILVHLDVDVIDPGTFPLGNVPSYTGLGFEEAMAAVNTLLKSDKVVGLSVAEVNPDHDPGYQMTARLVNSLVDGLKGKNA
jgi:arginase